MAVSLGFSSKSIAFLFGQIIVHKVVIQRTAFQDVSFLLQQPLSLATPQPLRSNCGRGSGVMARIGTFSIRQLPVVLLVSLCAIMPCLGVLPRAPWQPVADRLVPHPADQPTAKSDTQKDTQWPDLKIRVARCTPKLIRPLRSATGRGGLPAASMRRNLTQNREAAGGAAAAGADRWTQVNARCPTTVHTLAVCACHHSAKCSSLP